MISKTINTAIGGATLCLMLPLSADSGPTASFNPSSIDCGIPMVPNGTTLDAGWALARLNDASGAQQVFSYPETQTPVRLFLIDTAVANPNGWFDANPNLEIEHQELVRGSQQPLTSSAFSHGTKMLSLIAGPGTGAALGTPIKLVSYDVYPEGEGSASASGLIASAVSKAADYHLTHPGIPGIICIAASSASPGSSPALKAMIDSARADGLAVVVSAGNSSSNSAYYVPAAYGVDEGVICAAASNTSNQHLAMSNYGSAVDVYAPGENVRTLRFSNPVPGSHDLISGTSPAAALVTAAAVIKLSQNPELSPSQLESALKGSTVSTWVKLSQIAKDPNQDADGDGTSDLLEGFHGTSAASASSRPEAMKLTGTLDQPQITFKVAQSLFNPANPYTLNNGSTWKVLSTEDLKTWKNVGGSISWGSPVGSQIPVTISFPSTNAACYVRIALTTP